MGFVDCRWLKFSIFSRNAESYRSITRRAGHFVGLCCRILIILPKEIFSTMFKRKPVIACLFWEYLCVFIKYQSVTIICGYSELIINRKNDIHLFSLFRKLFSTIMGICAAICTVLTFWEPAVNAFALMLLVIPTFALLCSALKEYEMIEF